MTVLVAQPYRRVHGIRCRVKGWGASIGDRFERWTILGEQFRVGSRVLVVCQCTCGTVRVVQLGHLVTTAKMRSRSCGCLKSEVTASRSTTHGGARKGSVSRLYRIYSAIKQRCTDANTRAYKWYGAKGVKLCEAWANSFEAFRAWALANGYEDHLTIDRRESTGDYEPDNCRWITRRENGRLAMEKRWQSAT